MLCYSTPSHSFFSVLFHNLLFLHSWALRDVRDVSSLYVTQISSTFFSLHHHSMPPHTGESEHNTTASDTEHDVTVSGGDVIMGGDNIESTFKLQTPLSILHGFSHSDKEKEREGEGSSDRTIDTLMASIRVQQSNLTKDTDNHHHNARDKKYQVDVEFENSYDYNLVHTKMFEYPNLFNDSDTLKLRTENCDKSDFQKMKIQFSIGPEIDNLRNFVTSLSFAYPKH